MRPVTPAAEVMTILSGRTRETSRALRGDDARWPQAMPRVGERILVTQSPCARDASLRALSKEVRGKKSRSGRARVPSVASYPRTVSGAIRTVRDTCSTTGSHGSYLSDPYVVSLPLRWIAHFRGQGRGQGGAPGLIPSHGWQPWHSRGRLRVGWARPMPSGATLKARNPGIFEEY